MNTYEFWYNLWITGTSDDRIIARGMLDQLERNSNETKHTQNNQG